MRVEHVTALAFGPFHGERLDFAPGMTVIAGPNEAGKSTWHAAVRVALCGMPRRRGRPTAPDQEFADLHRPWDAADGWAVEARVQLDRGGRCVEIRQDLGGRLDSSAIELPIGRTVTPEILNDGSPDASRWLGLDRDAFATTVCVDQADVLAVARAAGALQEHLQRAAATRGSDATAAEAIERLRRFRSEAVGLDRPGAVRPLRRAALAREEAARELDQARREHGEYLRLAADADEARAAHEAALQALRRAESAAARAEAREAADRARQAHELAARHPTEPPGAPARDALADTVAAALAAWSARPAVPELVGEGADVLEERLAALPVVESGDLAPHPDARAAREEWVSARDGLQMVGARPGAAAAAAAAAASGGPGGPAEIGGDLTAAELESLATDLEARASAADPELVHGAELAARDVRARSRLALLALTAAAGAIVVAVLTAAADVVIAAVAAVLGAAACLVWALVGARARGRALAALDAAQQALETARLAEVSAAARRAEAARRLAAVGLPADPAAARIAARSRAGLAVELAAAIAWDQRHADAAARLATAGATLRAALSSRGEPAGDDLDAAWRAYEAACAARSAASSAAAQAPALRAAIDVRRQAEEQARRAREQVERAREGLRRAAAEAGCEAADDERVLAAALEGWQRTRAGRIAAHQAARTEWEHLQALLAGRSLEALDEEAAQLAQQADELTAQVDDLAAPRDDLAAPGDRLGLGAEMAADRAPGPPGRPAHEGEPHRRLADLRAREHALLERARELEGAVADRSTRLRDVAEAEEALTRAEVELARVRSLDATLETTISLLERAQDRAHRDVAPVLAAAVRAHLADVTDGRYDDAAVDPATLAVRVRERATGRWRTAQRLSHGTREQVYLLLRAAMAQHLVTNGETAPLLLDEVTAQSDERRKPALLDTLHGLSGTRQVILFTHDRDVVGWARQRLDPGRDRLIELERAAG